jgi:hypothetical protein
MSIFTDEENPESSLYLRKTLNIGYDYNNSQSIDLEIGLHPVVFGWRIRGGVIIQSKGYADYYSFDLCAGDKPEYISLIYTTTLNLIAKNLKNIQKDPNDLGISRIFPRFDIKPIVNDLFFPDFLSENLGGTESISVTVDQLTEWRTEFMSNF